jgi:hypothetical protein
MEWTFRTLIRGFLVIGGLGYMAWGVLDDSLVTLGFGVAAVLLGAFGLWSEFNTG